MVDIGSKTQQKNVAFPTFLNMPLHVANLVLEKLEPVDLLRARKVARSLRTAVDTIETCFNDVHLWLYDRELDLFLDRIRIIYNTAANGNSSVNHNRQKTIIDGENFVERALKDFKIVLKHARSIKILNNTENRLDIVTTFMEIFKSEKWILVNELKLWYFSFDEFFTILSCFEAKLLKKIGLASINSIDQFERIANLEQWKNAEEFRINDSKIASTMIVHFFHFKCFRIQAIDEFPAQTAIKIRDDLLRRNTFQSCEIWFEKSKSNPIEIAKVFKPDYIGGNEFKIEFSNGNDKFEISLQELLDYFVLYVKRL